MKYFIGFLILCIISVFCCFGKTDLINRIEESLSKSGSTIRVHSESPGLSSVTIIRAYISSDQFAIIMKNECFKLIDNKSDEPGWYSPHPSLSWWIPPELSARYIAVNGGVKVIASWEKGSAYFNQVID